MFYPGVPDILHHPASLLIRICIPIVDMLPSLRQNLGYLLDLDSLV